MINTAWFFAPMRYILGATVSTNIVSFTDRSFCVTFRCAPSLDFTVITKVTCSSIAMCVGIIRFADMELLFIDGVVFNPNILTVPTVMVSFTVRRTVNVSSVFAYDDLLLLVSMVRSSISSCGKSCTITVRVIIGPTLPAGSFGAV